MGKDNIIRFVASALLALVIWQQSSTVFFTHTHQVGNNIIVHSHPFSERTGGSQHSHSAIQFLTIALLSTIAGILGVSAFIAGLLLTGKRSYNSYSRRFVPHCILFTPTLRGPPALV